MKTIITKNLLALSFIALILALGACSKYEDGPWISFRSVEDRIIGKWKVEYFEIDGVDVTQQWIDNYNWSFEFMLDEYSSDQELLVFGTFCNLPMDSLGIIRTFWRLYENNRKIGFGILNPNLTVNDSLYCGIYPLETCKYTVFDIKKLTMDELWLYYNNSAHTYIIKYH